MNNDLISRSALKKEVERIKDTGYDTNNEPLFDFVELTTLFKLIDNAPTVEPNCEGCATWVKSTELLKKRLSYLERPQGEWEECGDYKLDTHYFKCSVCGELEEETSNYCPNCGSDNRGKNGAML